MQSTEETQPDASAELRNRVILPIIMPIGVLLGMGLFIGAMAFTFLHSTKGQAVVYAGIVATGLMVAMSLASATDEEDMDTPKRVVIAATALVPILAVVGLAAGVAFGGADPGGIIGLDRTPPERAPVGAIAGAQNSESFCTIVEDGDACEADTQELTFPAQPDGETFRFLFVNNHAGVAHNLQLFELSADDGPGEVIFDIDNGSNTIIGVSEVLYQVDQTERVFEVEEQFYYNCIVHPVMQGVLTIGEPVAAPGA
jgi:hypothetical protein